MSLRERDGFIINFILWDGGSSNVHIISAAAVAAASVAARLGRRRRRRRRRRRWRLWCWSVAGVRYWSQQIGDGDNGLMAGMLQLCAHTFADGQCCHTLSRRRRCRPRHATTAAAPIDLLTRQLNVYKQPGRAGSYHACSQLHLSCAFKLFYK